MKSPRKPKPQPRPKSNGNATHAYFEGLDKQIHEKMAWLYAADKLGEVGQYAAGTREHGLAAERDNMDQEFAHFAMGIACILRVRAEYSYNADLLFTAQTAADGDGHDALRIMRRCEKVCGDPGEDPLPGTFPESFAWQTYLRVSLLADLAAEFPKHIRHGARQMHGWPMIVSHHCDCRPEFERIAAALEVGRQFPLDVSPRRKRGTESPMLRFLEPLIGRLHVLREVLIETEETRKGEDFARRICPFWWKLPDPQPGPEMLAIPDMLEHLWATPGDRNCANVCRGRR